MQPAGQKGLADPATGAERQEAAIEIEIEHRIAGMPHRAETGEAREGEGEEDKPAAQQGAGQQREADIEPDFIIERPPQMQQRTAATRRIGMGDKQQRQQIVRPGEYCVLRLDA